MKKKVKRRHKRYKVIVITPFARAITSYESLTSATEAAKGIRSGFKSLFPERTRAKNLKGTAVYIEAED